MTKEETSTADSEKEIVGEPPTFTVDHFVSRVVIALQMGIEGVFATRAANDLIRHTTGKKGDLTKVVAVNLWSLHDYEIGKASAVWFSGYDSDLFPGFCRRLVNESLQAGAYVFGFTTATFDPRNNSTDDVFTCDIRFRAYEELERPAIVAPNFRTAKTADLIHLGGERLKLRPVECSPYPLESNRLLFNEFTR